MKKLTDSKGNVYWLTDKNRILVGENGVFLDITIDDHKFMEGEARRLTRKVAELRKTLGLKPTDPL
jgi:predicted nucleotidyltransferase